MTVNVEVPKDTHLGDGTSVQFPYTFTAHDPSWVKVAINSVDLLESEYTVDINNKTVTLNTAPSAGNTVTVHRDVPGDQLVDYTDYSRFPADTHEGALDKLTMITQEHAEELSRVIKAPIDAPPDLDYTLPSYQAGHGLMWDGAEKKLALSESPLNNIVGDAEAARDAAQASAAAAATSEANAAASEANAATSEANAATSETNAATSEAKAQQWAEEPEDSEVEPGLYSAHHWANKAEQHATEAHHARNMGYDNTVSGAQGTDVQAVLDEVWAGYFNRQWVDETANRAINTAYQNTNPHPIDVNISTLGPSGAARTDAFLEYSVDGINWFWVARTRGTGQVYQFVTATIPPGGWYRLNDLAGTNSSINVWVELK